MVAFWNQALASVWSHRSHVDNLVSPLLFLECSGNSLENHPKSDIRDVLQQCLDIFWSMAECEARSG